ncbi:MAG: heme exporter protein CcmD [Afipia sp.]|jgi:heme exporter protein D|nr:heme exporter protein CcmD [Afipia sp.]
MTLGPYTSFIITSYALVTIVVVTLIVGIARDFYRQKQALNNLEARGVKRRSVKSSGKSK